VFLTAAHRAADFADLSQEHICRLDRELDGFADGSTIGYGIDSIEEALVSALHAGDLHLSQLICRGDVVVPRAADVVAYSHDIIGRRPEAEIGDSADRREKVILGITEVGKSVLR